MMGRPASENKIGRVPTLLVVQSDQRAFLCTVTAEHRENAGEQRVHFSGGAIIAPAVADHVVSVVVPLVEGVCRLLGESVSRWDIVYESIEAAAACETPLSVSGNSGDLSLFLVLLSSALQLPLRQDAVATGLFTSAAGGIGSVGSIPEKLHAAIADSRMRLFLHPPFGVDKSLDALVPDEYSRIEEAVADARRKAIRLTPVKDVADLVREVLDEESIVLSSLHKGYFDRGFDRISPDTPVTSAARHLLAGNQTRFWHCLGNALRSQEPERVSLLLSAYLQFHERKESYPSRVGAQLIQRLRTLPPVMRRALPKPLVPSSMCFAVARYAFETDTEDAQALLKANKGQTWLNEGESGPEDPEVPAAKLGGDDADQTLDAILNQLSGENVVKAAGRDIDNACVSFSTDSSLASSADAFTEVVTSFYLHLLSETGVLLTRINSSAAERDALRLVEQAFHKQGGLEGARREAEIGVNGGLRAVLDAMADYYRTQAVENHIMFVLETALDDRDRPAKVALIRAFLRRFEGLLPPDIAQTEPEDLVGQWKVIAHAYARSLDSLKNLIRRL